MINIIILTTFQAYLDMLMDQGPLSELISILLLKILVNNRIQNRSIEINVSSYCCQDSRFSQDDVFVKKFSNFAGIGLD